MKPNRTARCRICGQSDRKLSFEHIPPRSAFNSRRVKVHGIMHWLKRDASRTERAGKYQQRGAGFSVFCRGCNSKLGRWYVREYAAWAARGVDLIRRFPPYADADANPADAVATVVLRDVSPLLFLKQVASMILAVNRAEVGDTMAELRSFVLDKHAQHLPNRYVFYVALYRGPKARYHGLAGKWHIVTKEQHFFSEMAYPPFACCLSVDERTPLLDYGNITHFKDYDPHAVVELELPLIVGFGHTWYPADYRSAAAIQHDLERQRH